MTFRQYRGDRLGRPPQVTVTCSTAYEPDFYQTTWSRSRNLMKVWKCEHCLQKNKIEHLECHKCGAPLPDELMETA